MQVPSASLVNPMQIPFFAYSKERSWNGFETEVERTWNGPGTDLQRTYCYGKNKADANFLKELNAKHVHGGEFCMITHCVSKRL